MPSSRRSFRHRRLFTVVSGNQELIVFSRAQCQASLAVARQLADQPVVEIPVIDPDYLPFTRDELWDHFLVDSDRQTERFVQSARRYRDFVSTHPDRTGIPIIVSRFACQIEKDERFWTATAVKRLVDSPQRSKALIDLLNVAFGEKPPFPDFQDWWTCIDGPLKLVLEATIPSPVSYVNWLRANLSKHHFVPYVMHAAQRQGARTLEGATHVDAVIVNPRNGFALLIESKVVSDLSPVVSFDVFRNQVARNLDVMLEPSAALPEPLQARRADRSLFALLTPKRFRERPHSRLYGWLLEEYRGRDGLRAIARDLPHRATEELRTLPERIGWLTFEQINAVVPNACPWLSTA